MGFLEKYCKHNRVQSAILVEIDEEVIKASEQFLPNIAVGLKHPKAIVKIEEGSKYLAQNQKYDVIISDSTDPYGSGEHLFTQQFYQNIKEIYESKWYFCSSNGKCIL